MGPKKIFTVSLKLGVLTMLFYICNIIASLSAGLGRYQQPSDPKKMASAALFVSFLSVVAISYPIIKSRWTGWRLVLTVFVMIFGIRTFLTQVETLVFLKYLVNIIPADMIPLLFVEGFITAAIFSPLAVLILGKFKPKMEPFEFSIDMSVNELVWRLLLIGIIYLIIYILFGMFVFKPLAGKVFDEFYINLHLPQWIIPFQIVRGMIWAIIAFPVVKMMKGTTWEKGLSVALLFSLLMGALLLIPTDIMPERIRMSHFVEVTSSNFAFGWIAVWLLTKQRVLPEKIN